MLLSTEQWEKDWKGTQGTFLPTSSHYEFFCTRLQFQSQNAILNIVFSTLVGFESLILIVILRAFITVPAEVCRWKLHSLSSTDFILCFCPSLLESVGIVLVVFCVVTGSVRTSVLSDHKSAASSPQPGYTELWHCSWKFGSLRGCLWWNCSTLS